MGKCPAEPLIEKIFLVRIVPQYSGKSIVTKGWVALKTWCQQQAAAGAAGLRIRAFALLIETTKSFNKTGINNFFVS